jgi:hypothetical protein
MRYTTILLLLYLGGHTAFGQEGCPTKKDTILPGMLEDLIPIDRSLVGLRTYFMDADFQIVSKEADAVYRFQIPEYRQQGSELLVPKLGKAASWSPLIKPGMEKLHGEVIYRKGRSIYHVTFLHGMLASVTREHALDGNYISSTNYATLFDENPTWIRTEYYDWEGQVGKITYWYECGGQIMQQSWKKYY